MATCLGRSCSFGCAFRRLLSIYVFIFPLLVLRAGYGIRLYQFLIIASLFTLSVTIGVYHYHDFYFYTQWPHVVYFSSGYYTYCHSRYRSHYSRVKEGLITSSFPRDWGLLQTSFSFVNFSSRQYFFVYIKFCIFWKTLSVARIKLKASSRRILLE